MTPLQTLPTITGLVRFHISLNVSDLAKAVEFYSILFDCEPAKLRNDYAKFETDEPPLVVSLEPNNRAGGGTLNHMGIRLPDARRLVAVQERLERAGLRSQRQEGVECCYALQTKFWMHDPDGTLWEFYVLVDDGLEHRGAGQSLEAMTGSTLPDNAVVWEHRLGDATDGRLEPCDASCEEVRLRGSFNVPLSDDEQRHLLEEAWRMLKPGGRLLIRILSGEKQHDHPDLPGSGSLVRFVPAKEDIVHLIARTNFTGLRLLKYDDPPCFVHDGIPMRETHIEAFRHEQ